MRLSLPPLLVGALCCCLGGVACDRVNELKDKLLGSSTSGNDVNPELEAIRSLYESGDYEGALQRIASTTESDPNLAEAYYYRGLCYLAKAGETASVDASAPLSPDEESSLEAFRRALSINPRHAPSNVGLGDLYSRRVPARRRRGNSEDPEDPYVLAITAYRQAVTIDPTLPEAQHRFGVFLERTGQLDEAEQAYRAAADAAAVVPETAPDYYAAYGRFLAGAADRQDEALDQFELAQMFRQDDLSIQQEIAIVHARIGLRHFDKQEYMLAQSELEEAVGMFPDPNIPEAQKANDALNQLRSIRRR
jgi:tetratricopeptide (TPR) repeat protein